LHISPTIFATKHFKSPEVNGAGSRKKTGEAIAPKGNEPPEKRRRRMRRRQKRGRRSRRRRRRRVQWK
jgi:hypothetical protein